MASSRRAIPEYLEDAVRERANGLCEYCHATEKWQYVRFTIDHVIALAEGGADESENLALACFHCNRRKSNHLTGIDPESELSYKLFNPRLDDWAEHFIWSTNGTEIVGLTPTGRATITLLQLNRPRIVNIRLADVAVGRHPPPDDPIMGDV
ncbi:HNH endonuclease [Chloroflexi bacterium TSY]|nr:HNH endonuclease [Chloroflexi bacterium TSY]